MPSGHSSSSHSSSSSGSSSGGSHSGSSGGFSSGGGGGHSHHNDSLYHDSHSIFPSHIQGLFWFIGVAVVFGIILWKVDINEELNRHSNSNPVIYETVSSTGTSGAANTSSNTAATTAETSRRSTQSFKKYSPGYGIIHDRIYVPEIGRECVYDAGSDNYYDKVTDCYFWLNNTLKTPVWQYWYEGISSDYGDYGWMEYDYSKNAWFIETEKGKWESDDFAFLKNQ